MSTAPEAPVKALIFDFDGTLVDTMPTHFLAWSNLLPRHGLSLSEERFYALGGWSTRRLSELLISEAGLSLPVEQLVREKEAEFERLATQVRPIEPVVEIARRHRGELPMAVATSGLRRIVEPILRKVGYADWFAAVVTADDVVHPKPAPDLFLEAARRLHVEPYSCRVYEDTEAGLVAARRAGMPCVDVREMIGRRA
jgi:HAD superfamily hydrolase (TIGR01509 family)